MALASTGEVTGAVTRRWHTRQPAPPPLVSAAIGTTGLVPRTSAARTGKALLAAG